MRKVQVLLSATEPNGSEDMWELYQAMFAPAKTECVQQQLCYTEQSLHEALQDQEIWKFVAYLDDKPVALGLATFNLTKAQVAYVNPDRLNHLFPDYYGRILYFTCIGIHPEFQTQHGIFSKLIEEMTIFTDRYGALVVFDFSTEKNALLPNAIVKYAQKTQRGGLTKTTNARYKQIGAQEYGLIELS